MENVKYEKKRKKINTFQGKFKQLMCFGCENIRSLELIMQIENDFQ